jgi:hypothetical protein
MKTFMRMIAIVEIKLVLLLVIQSVAFGQQTKTSNVQADATWEFWQGFNKAAVSGPGVEALEQNVPTHPIEIKDRCRVFEDIISTERRRAKLITSLPVLNVDSEAVKYATEFESVRTHLADAMQDYVSLLREQENIVSTPELSVDLLLNVLNHSEDKEDGIFWKALLDTGKQTVDQIQSLKEPALKVGGEMVAAAKATAKLKIEEMSVRSALSQKYDREFPPLANYAEAAAKDNPAHKVIPDKQIIRSLLGKSVGGLFDGWTFDSQKEFASLEVIKIVDSGDLVKNYIIKTHVKGINSGQERDFKLRLTYLWYYTRWLMIDCEELQ